MSNNDKLSITFEDEIPSEERPRTPKFPNNMIIILACLITAIVAGLVVFGIVRSKKQSVEPETESVLSELTEESESIFEDDIDELSSQFVSETETESLTETTTERTLFWPTSSSYESDNEITYVSDDDSDYYTSISQSRVYTTTRKITEKQKEFMYSRGELILYIPEGFHQTTIMEPEDNMLSNSEYIDDADRNLIGYGEFLNGSGYPASYYANLLADKYSSDSYIKSVEGITFYCVDYYKDGFYYTFTICSIDNRIVEVYAGSDNRTYVWKLLEESIHSN